MFLRGPLQTLGVLTAVLLAPRSLLPVSEPHPSGKLTEGADEQQAICSAEKGVGGLVKKLCHVILHLGLT